MIAIAIACKSRDLPARLASLAEIQRWPAATAYATGKATDADVDALARYLTGSHPRGPEAGRVEYFRGAARRLRARIALRLTSESFASHSPLPPLTLDHDYQAQMRHRSRFD
jgi:hypothetical protein